MTIAGDYNLYLTARNDHFGLNLDDLARLIDYLDLNLYLDGPDRDYSRLVIRSSVEVERWKPLARAEADGPLEYLRRRQVYILHSPAAAEEIFKNYSDLLQKLDALLPRDKGLIASLGYASRKLFELVYCPVPGQEQPWIDRMLVHLVQGYHPAWQRMYNEVAGYKEWQLLGVKAFMFLISCKVKSQAVRLSIDDFIAALSQKPEFLAFLNEIGEIIGTKDFELIGGTTE